MVLLGLVYVQENLIKFTNGIHIPSEKRKEKPYTMRSRSKDKGKQRLRTVTKDEQ